MRSLGSHLENTLFILKIKQNLKNFVSESIISKDELYHIANINDQKLIDVLNSKYEELINIVDFVGSMNSSDFITWLTYGSVDDVKVLLGKLKESGLQKHYLLAKEYLEHPLKDILSYMEQPYPEDILNDLTEEVSELSGMTKPKGIVKKYMETNDKELVPEILKMIENNPTLKLYNDNYKRDIKTLYRGVSLDKNYIKSEIFDYEMSQPYVATSRSEQVARSYAKGQNQIGGKNGTDNKYAAIITYVINDPESILFDLAVFGNDYGNLETLIIPNKAKITNIEIIYK